MLRKICSAEFVIADGASQEVQGFVIRDEGCGGNCNHRIGGTREALGR